MFRRWLSNFLNKNKEKIEIIVKILIIVAIVVFVMYIYFSNGNTNISTQSKTEIYKPQETITSGSTISEEKYQEDSNLVDIFIGYCNEKKVEDAYNLLTEDCKNNLYPTVEDFKLKYCDRYFAEKKEYSLQSWSTKGEYDVYQIRIINNMMATGKYDDEGAYQDYITIVSDGDNKKININGFIYTKEINKNTNTNELKIDVKKVDVYMDYEEYTLEVTNNTENIIMLDSMRSPASTLGLELEDGNIRSVNTNSISFIELMLNPGETRSITIQFVKKYTTSVNSMDIVFSNVVKNYNEFTKNRETYTDFIEVKVEV